MQQEIHNKIMQQEIIWIISKIQSYMASLQVSKKNLRCIWLDTF
jgi:hypothetical protein